MRERERRELTTEHLPLFIAPTDYGLYRIRVYVSVQNLVIRPFIYQCQLTDLSFSEGFRLSQTPGGILAALLILYILYSSRCPAHCSCLVKRSSDLGYTTTNASGRIVRRGSSRGPAELNESANQRDSTLSLFIRRW